MNQTLKKAKDWISSKKTSIGLGLVGTGLVLSMNSCDPAQYVYNSTYGHNDYHYPNPQVAPPKPAINLLDPQYKVNANYLVDLVMPSGEVYVVNEIPKFSESVDGSKNILSFKLENTNINGKQIFGEKKFLYRDKASQRFDDYSYSWITEKTRVLDTVIVSGVYNAAHPNKPARISADYLRMYHPDILSNLETELEEGLNYLYDLQHEEIYLTFGERNNNVPRPVRWATNINF